MQADGMVLDAAKVRALCRSRGVPVAAEDVLPADVLASYAAESASQGQRRPRCAECLSLLNAPI